MKKKFYMFALTLLMFLTCAIIFSACGKAKVTDISVYIGGELADTNNNTIEITYGEYLNANEINWDNFITVKLNYSDNTQSDLHYGDNGYSILGLPNTLNANEAGYNLSISYKDFGAINLKLIVNKSTFDMSNVYWNYDQSFTYDGTEKSIELLGLPSGVTATYQNNVATNAGEHSATATLVYDSNNYALVNDENLNLSCDWKINKSTFDVSNVYWNYDQSFTYDGTEKSIELLGLPTGVTATYQNNVATNAGEYSATATLVYDSNKYALVNDENLNLSCDWEIDKIQVETPIESNESFVYDGTEKVKITYYNNDNLFTVNGHTSATNAGSYSTIFTLNDKTNYEWTSGNSEDLVFNWKIDKADNTISGQLEINDWVYGETPNTPSGLSAETGAITYKYYIKDNNDDYFELGTNTPTNAGTYYVAGHSLGNNNWTAYQSDYVQFEISRVYLNSPQLLKNSFIYSGSEYTPTINNLPDSSLVTCSGDLTQTEVGNYQITIALKDTTNYGWQDYSGTEIDDIILEWNIIGSPITITLNGVDILDNNIEELTEFEIGDIFSIAEKGDFHCEVKYTTENSTNTLSSLTNITVGPQFYSFIIIVSHNSLEVYNKTIVVNRDIVENVTIGEDTISFEEFVSNPTIKYGETLTINFKSQYSKKFYTYNKYTTPDTNSYTITEDTTIYICTVENSELVTSIDVICDMNVLTDIFINNENITFNELKNMERIPYGSTLTFTVDSQFDGIISVKAQDTQLTGSQSYTFDTMNSLSIQIIDTETSNYLYGINLQPIVFENISINGNQIALNDIFCIYQRDLNENSFEIQINKILLTQYEMYYETSANYQKVQLTQSTLNLSIDDIGKNINFYIKINDKYQQVLILTFEDFTPIVELTAVIVEFNGEYSSTLYIYDGKITLTSNGAIKNLDIQFKEKYQACTYKIFNNSDTEIQNFATIQDGVYNLKVYLEDTEIYTLPIEIIYQFNNIINGLQYLSERNVPMLITDSATLTTTLPTGENISYSNQSITFNEQNSITLTEGQNTVSVVYTFDVESTTYTYAFDMIVDYVSGSPTSYVSSIIIECTDKWGTVQQITFNSDLQLSEDSQTIYLTDLAFVTEENITITTTYTVVSKEIKFSSDKTLCWLEYTISVDEQNKTFRAYIQTSGTISNNTNAQFIFTDAITNEDITKSIVDDSYTIDNVNIFGNIEVLTEDSEARVEFYYGSELQTDGFLNITSTGTYTIKIIPSDNTTTRIITIIVNKYESLMFEVFYGKERLYLEYNEEIPAGNVKMIVDEATETISFIGYFGPKNPEDESSVTLTGNTVYENMLYYSDKITPIADLNNINLELQTDTDGSITGIAGAEYVLVYMIMQNECCPIYFVFADYVYPMTFTFDKNGNNQIDESDTIINLKLNIYAGDMDLGDFSIGESCPVINVTRDKLGMGAEDTSVSTTVSWTQTYEDLSYKFTTTYPSGEETPTLIGPTEGNLKSTITLTFVDSGDGILKATIYVCAEGETSENVKDILIPVIFVLTE